MPRIHPPLMRVVEASPSHGFQPGPGFYALWVVVAAIVITILYFVIRSAVRSNRNSGARKQEH